MRGLIVGALLAAVVVACMHGGPPKNTREQKMTEIIALWTQIRTFRHEANMKGLDPSPATVSQYVSKSVSEARQVCPENHVVPKTCGDVCSLGNAICDNAEAICGLADQLGKDDQQAQEKCTSAKASCREASQNCCICSKNPPKDSTTTPDNTAPSPMPALPTTPTNTSPLPAPSGAPHP